MSVTNVNEDLTAASELFLQRYNFAQWRDLNALLLGPVVGLLLWVLPLGLEPVVQKTFALFLFMIIYWVMGPVDHAVTAMIGCYLFWALGIVEFSVAFGGFASTTPWYLFGGLLIGEAAARTGLAKRLGYNVLQLIGTSYSRLILGVTTLSFLITFLIPSGTARLTVIASILIGIVGVLDSNRTSNVGRGLFLVLSNTCGLFDKMIMAGAAAILTRGIVREQTGTEILWSQWFLAFLPASVLTIFICWITILRLYPAGETNLSLSKDFFHQSLAAMGPWSPAEKRLLLWIVLATALWSTDFIHHIDPATMGLGAGLLLVLPRFGVLDTEALRRVNFLVVLFSAGAVSMANVLAQTQALSAINEHLIHYIEPLLSNGFSSAVALYWGGVLYHFLFPSNQSMLSSSLPLLLEVAQTNGYNPVALALIWAFAGGGTIFAYQSSVLVLGYSYGYFTAKDLVKVGTALMLIEGLLLIVLVPLYWPMIGLHWSK